jgi:hypothetical protein
MILIKKIDVPNHLAARRRARAHSMHLVTKPVVATTEKAAIELSEEVFTGDFSLEHFSPGGAITAVVIPAPEDKA